MEALSPIATTLYAQLQELAFAEEVRAFFAGAGGHALKREIRGRDYWYWSGRTGAGGSPRSLYLGPDDAETRVFVELVRTRQAASVEASLALESAAAAFVAAGGTPQPPAHARALEHLADAGIFRKGLFVVGSHAFIAYGNMLGFRFGREATATLDIDVARAAGLALAVPTNPDLAVDVPAEMEKFDRTSFLVPALDPRQPSISIKSGRTHLVVAFLTTLRPSQGAAPVWFPDLRIAAQPLRFMDYLLAGTAARGLLLARRAIPVTLPDPARFALHKLVVAMERPVASAAKARKDLHQAAQLLRALSELHSPILDAARAALRAVPGAQRRVGRALPLLRAVDPAAAELAAG